MEKKWSAADGVLSQNQLNVTPQKRTHTARREHVHYDDVSRALLWAFPAPSAPVIGRSQHVCGHCN